MTYWILDCCVLVNCNEENCNHEFYMDCMKLLIYIKERDGICLDATNQIYNEYFVYIKPNTFLSKWWKGITRTQGKTHYCSAHLPNKHKAKLSKMKFHKNDYKYVGTAFNSPDQNLVTFDSHYHAEIVNYLETSCNINVFHPSDCYQY